MSPTRSHNLVYGVFKGMGDLIAAAPVVRSELDRGGSVTLLIHAALSSFLPLLDFGPGSDRLQVRVVPTGQGLGGIRRLFATLAAQSPDLVLVSPHAPGPAASWRVPLTLIICRALFWRRARLVGARSERFSALFSRRYPVDRELPLAEREWSLYRQAWPGRAAEPGVVRFKASMYPRPGVEPAFDLIIHPGATADNRKWPQPHYAQLLERLPQALRVAVVGLPSDLEPFRALAARGRPLTFISGTLEEAIESLGRARVALTMDSGSMFFANILGLPTVALFGPSAPQFVLSPRSSVLPVYDPTLPCQPCRSATCRIGTIECMARIAPQRVAERITEALAGAGRR